jgi:hypothetical protein
MIGPVMKRLNRGSLVSLSCRRDFIVLAVPPIGRIG